MSERRKKQEVAEGMVLASAASAAVLAVAAAFGAIALLLCYSLVSFGVWLFIRLFVLRRRATSGDRP